MSLTRKWKTTRDGTPPSGRKRTGTFRDISLVKLPPEIIEEIDQECIDKNISRLQLQNLSFLRDKLRDAQNFQNLIDAIWSKDEAENVSANETLREIRSICDKMVSDAEELVHVDPDLVHRITELIDRVELDRRDLFYREPLIPLQG